MTSEARPEDELLALHDEEEQQASEEERRPESERHGLGVEQRLERRRVGEEQLQDHDRADTQRQIRVAEVGPQGQRRVELVAAVEQVEDLADDQGVHGDRPGEIVRCIPGLGPEERPQRERQQQRPDEGDAPDPEGVQDRTVDRSGRSLHDVLLVGLEGDDQPERDGRHHVDPEDLRRRDRRGEAHEDGRHDDQPLGDVRRQHEQHRLLDVVVDGAALSHGRRDRREVVVGQYHGGRLLGDLGALDPHGDADVGLLESGRVVHPVARHRDDLLVRLDGLHQTELVLGARAREDVAVADSLLQRGLVRLLDLGPADRRRPVADAQHLGDGRRGDLVVPGDHRDPDAAAVTLPDGLDGFLARRVEQPDQTEQHQVLRQVLRTEAPRRDARILEPCEGQHPLPVPREPVRRLHPMIAIDRRMLSALGLLPVAVIEDDLGRSLGEQHLGAARRAVQGRHEFVFRFERDDVDTRGRRLARLAVRARAWTQTGRAPPPWDRPPPSRRRPPEAAPSRCTAWTRAP